MQIIYTGKELDQENNLQYYGARYLDNTTGRFNSIDPALFIINDDQAFTKAYGRSVQEQLANPQNLNSYSYAGNNPVKYTDPDGNNPILFALGVAFSSLFWNIPVAQAPGNDYNPATVNSSESRDFVGSIYEPYNNWSGPQKFGVILLLGGIEERLGTGLSTKYAASQAQIDRVIGSAEGAYSSSLASAGKHHNWMMQYLDKSAAELKKGMQSFGKRIQEHIEKLQNPAKYINDFGNASEQYIQGQIRQWEKHLQRNQEQQNILKGILNNLK